jgi:hypothetical protein
MINIMKRLTISILVLIFALSLTGQTVTKESALKREVTLYNPFKPTVQEATKKSYLPDMSDTVAISPEFSYEVSPRPFMPEYKVSPIKAASLIADPLPKLYKSYINAGFGNYITPLAEVSISNTRSKKGAIGFYAKHLSTSGKVKLDNDIKVFAGYMDNEASLYGKRFLKKSVLEGSLDYNQYVRHAYGYEPGTVNYDPTKKEIRLNYMEPGARINIYSTTTDSADLSYNFGLKYDLFYQNSNLWENNFEFNGYGAKEYKGFYVGSGLDINVSKLSPFLHDNLRNIVSVTPFVSKSSALWSFNAGIKLVTETSQPGLLSNPVQDDYKTQLHLYPDIRFSFNIVPSFINFFAGLGGELENNQPLKVIGENPYLNSDGILFNLPNTDHELIINTGVKGNAGTDGSYLLSASYSVINDLLLYKNYHFIPVTPGISETSNLFTPETDNAELLNLHGELVTSPTERLSLLFKGNYYNYTMTSNDFAWNKPEWDATVGLRYNLRNKILAGAELSAEGKRKALLLSGTGLSTETVFELPAHLNINLSAEYRYTKILSFWVKINNISFTPYNEWLFYPTMRFVGMVGFTYSL